jgi:IMP dehydrogenase/GMP reductase
VTQVEIGRGKSGRRAYALDEIGIVPSRRTRHPEEVSIAWQIDAYRFELPLVVAPMDRVVSPATAVEQQKIQQNLRSTPRDKKKKRTRKTIMQLPTN